MELLRLCTFLFVFCFITIQASPSKDIDGSGGELTSDAPLSDEEMKIEKEMQERLEKEGICDTAREMNDFGFELQKHISKKNAMENLVFSPYSIYVSLALLSLGARQKSEKQITSALNSTNNPEDLVFMKKIADLLSTDEKDVDTVLVIANNGWVASDQDVLQPFLTKSKKYFGVKYQKEDFGDTEAARDRINKWVSDHTGHRIVDLFPANSIGPETKMVLANAVYFKGQWKYPFNEKRTHSYTFTRYDGQIVKDVPYMYQTGTFNAGFHGNVQLLELPYGEKGEFSMLFAKPSDIKRLGKEINADLLDKWLDSMKEETYDIRIPRFTLKQRVDLNDKLKSMGITDVFTRGLADLSGITKENNLYLSSAVHQSYIEVSERGTKAMAATGISIGFYSLLPTIELDRPFFFFIINKSCNSVIFSGEIMDPKL